MYFLHTYLFEYEEKSCIICMYDIRTFDAYLICVQELHTYVLTQKKNNWHDMTYVKLLKNVGI